MKKQQRVGGAAKVEGADPETKIWLSQGARNPNSLTTKQKHDKARVRARYDIDPRLKTAIEKAARSQNIDTSFSQFAEILLTVAMNQYLDGKLNAYFQNSTAANSMRFGFDYELPDEFERVASYGAIDGAV